MSECKCGCGIYTLDTESATLVLNGIPQCTEQCLRRAEKRDARAARDVPVGERWCFTDHRSQADVQLARRALVARVVH